MIRVTRHDLSPRIELLPMIDVVFLLLTFFIYSMVMMVRADVLPVQLVGVGTGEAAEPGEISAITIDRAGQLFLDREPIDAAALEARLREMAQRDAPPALFLAMEEAGEADGPPVDRGPLLTYWIERVRAAGIDSFSIVGPAVAHPAHRDAPPRSGADP